MARLRLTVALACLLAVAAGQASVAGGAGALKPADLVADGLVALQKTKSAHYVIDAAIAARTSGAVTDPQLKALTANPVSLHLEADASPTAIVASLTAKLSGQTLAAKLLVGPHQLFANLMGRWFGSKTMGLADLLKTASAQSGTALDLSPAKSIPFVRQHLNDFLKGQVGEGPALEGKRTWQFAGTLNADGIAALVGQFLKGITPERAALEALAGRTRVLIVADQDDKLLRELQLTSSLTQDDLQKLQADSRKLKTPLPSPRLQGIESIALKLTVGLSKFGEPVSFQAPASFQPLEQLLAGLVGGATATKPAQSSKPAKPTQPTTQTTPGSGLAAQLSVSWQCPPATLTATVSAQSGQIESVTFSAVSGGSVLLRGIDRTAPFSVQWPLKGLPKSFEVRAEVAGGGQTLTLEQPVKNCLSP